MDQAILNAIDYFYNMFNNEYEIVVAHYNENLNYLKKFNKTKINVYSKGNVAEIPCINFKVPNIGREAHTYLRYIIDRYDSLPNIVFFTQGRIDDHYDVNIRNTFLNIKNTHSENHTFSDGEYGFRLNKWNECKLKPAECVFHEWFHKYIDSSINIKNGIQIYRGAIFSVRKEKILSRPKYYYEEMIKQLDKNNTEVGHYFERSWYYIFNLHNP